MRVSNHGSLFLLTPETDAERAWVAECVDVPDWAWVGGSFACEPRLVEDLLAGLAAEVPR